LEISLTKQQKLTESEGDKMTFTRKKSTKKKLALGTAVGGVAGYLAGILTAPKSGSQTRKDITNKAGEVKDETGEQLQRAVDELNAGLKTAKGKSINMSAKARAEFDETLIKARDAQNKASEVLKAFRGGESNDPELNKAVKQVKQAQKNLGKYLKS
jgi:gas vesicle protein